MDWSVARRHMVDGQLRPNRVTDPRVLAAMGELPRERCVPAGLRGRAYADGGVPLPGGRAMLDPTLLARLVQLAAVRADDTVLLLGANTGYGAVLLARLGARVIALEEDAELRNIAAAALAELTPPGAVRLIPGPPAAGWSQGAPYAVILIEGAVERIPETLDAQLAEGGRLLAIRDGRAVLGRRIGGTFGTTPQFDAAATPVPGFAATPAFVF